MESPTYFSVNIRAINQVMMGRFLRSLYVGKMTEYLSPSFFVFLVLLLLAPAAAAAFLADARAMLLVVCHGTKDQGLFSEILNQEIKLETVELFLEVLSTLVCKRRGFNEWR